MSLILDKINYVYSEGTAYQIQALKDVNLEIRDGQFIGVIGHTGSGKSTLIQHLNGLVKATSGTIYFNGQDIYDEDFDLRDFETVLDLYFSTRSISYLRRPFLMMCVLDRKIRDCPRKKQDCVHLRH